MQMTGAQIVVNCLLEQGVDTVFGFPGGAVLYIYDALYQYSDRLTHVLTCHEQGAAHAADGYARSSGKPGVVIATSGPGATNLVTGIATAYMDSVPLVAITGNVTRNLLGKDSFQEVDITGITMPVTKHNFIVKDVDDLADTLRRAFYIAQSGRPGPVLVDIPKDVTAVQANYEPKAPRAIEPYTRDIGQKALENAARMIRECERPLIYAGGGVIHAEASDELRAFARRISAPVTLSLMGIGAYPHTDPRYTGMIGMHGTKTSSLAVSGCDLLIAVGSRFSDRVICNPNTFASRAKVLHIYDDAAEINKNIRADQSIVGNAKEVLARLNALLPAQSHLEWLRQIGRWKDAYPIDQPKRGEVMPQQIIEKVWELTGGEAIVTTEVGQHQMWAAQFLKVDSPRRFITSGGLGTMGFGLGAAIGAQVANPGRRVVNIAGDGSFHMNLQELATAVSYDLPIVEVLMNNNALGMVRQWQRMFYGARFSHTTLNRKTDYQKLAESFGALGFRIDAQEDIEPVLREALASRRPCVVDCRIGSDVNVLPMVPAGGTIEEPLLTLES